MPANSGGRALTQVVGIVIFARWSVFHEAADPRNDDHECEGDDEDEGEEDH